jgi:anti-sigma regulatory factor (Ser/Thr protein kinase)
MVARVAAHVDSGALVILLSGRWGVAQAGALRRALARCAAHYPPFIIVDCSRVPPGRLLATLLPAVVMCQGSRRPGISVLLCAPTPVLAILLRRLPGARVALYPRFAEALRGLRPHDVPPGVRRTHRRLAPIPEAAMAARRLLREFCDRWDLPEALEKGQLIVSELVANAVEHAGTEIDLTIAHHRRRLRIAVADRHHALPDFGRRLPAAGEVPDAESLLVRGRGLALVSHWVTRCGVLRAPDGKVVWASLALPRSRRIRVRLPDLSTVRRYLHTDLGHGVVH